MIKTINLFLFLFIATTIFAHENENRVYRFIENKGQFEKQVKYKAKINGGALFLESKAFTFHLQDNSILNKFHLGQEVKPEEQFIKGHAYKVVFENAQEAQFEATKKSTDYNNYYIGNDQSKWVTEAYSYANIRMNQLYAGIDLEINTTENEELKYTYYVKANSDASQIKQTYKGIDELKLQGGNLIITTNVNKVIEEKPIAWQTINGERKEVACEFVLTNKTISYNFPNGYNHNYELIIDPILIFGSYTGSTADNFGMTATYDSQGNLITGGMAYNTGFPTTLGAYSTTANANGTTYGVTDVVITKFNGVGNNLVFSTYIGGGNGTGGTETVHSLISDDNDNLLLFGVTSSTDFPTTNGSYDQSFNGGSFIGFVQNGAYFDNGTDLYVAKFNSTGTNLLASTFIGGSDNDGVNYNLNYLSGGNWFSNYDSLQFNYGDQFRGEIMVDDLGNCYVTSTTRSTDFPTQNGFQPTKNNKQDAVAFKFDANLSNLIWSTFIGGNDKDAGYSIKVDDSYNAYVAGGTASSDFTTTPGVLHPSFLGGKSDGFLVKISPTGNTLLLSTFIGTNAYDQVFFVELDRFNDVHILGQTQGTSVYPIVNVAYSTPNSGQFVTKLDNTFSSITFSTLFGNGNGGINISPSAFLVDLCGNIYVSGWGANILQSTPLNGMDVTPNAFQSSNGDGFNFYLIVFSRNINSVLYASYFGGATSHEHVDGGTSRFDENGIVYQSVCAGCGSNDDFPTTPGAWSNVNLSTNCNNGVFKYDFEITPTSAFILTDTIGCAPLTVQFSNSSSNYSDYFWDFGNNDTTSTDPNPIRTFPNPGTYTVYLVVEDSVCGLLLDTAVQNITVLPIIPLTATADDYVLIAGNSTQLHALPNGYTYVWTPPLTLNDPNIQDPIATPTSTTTYTVSILENPCRTATVTIEIVDAICEEPYIFIPNAFTPNGDGENDLLKVRFPDDNFIHYEYIFRVYNRWGEKVWETNQLGTQGWDGTFQGRDCDPAVFDYYLEVLCPGGAEYFKKGNVTLIR